MIKGSVKEEDIKREMVSSTIIVEDFNTTLTPVDISSKQKMNKEAQVLNNTLDEMDLIATFRTFHPSTEEYTFSILGVLVLESLVFRP